jgi:uncharacterized membrane protein YvbJ
MPLIACPDCSTQVSNRAPTCPKCGAPIAGRSEAIAVGTPLVTTQATSKRLKVHTLVAILAAVIGVIWMVGAAHSANPSSSAIGMLLLLAGMCWFVVTRARIWWHHK